MPIKERKYWDVGAKGQDFRLSKDRCQKFLYALMRCKGQLHDSYSIYSISNFRDIDSGAVKVHQIYVVLRISLPEGEEKLFQEIVGDSITLSAPPRIVVN